MTIQNLNEECPKKITLKLLPPMMRGVELGKFSFGSGAINLLLSEGLDLSEILSEMIVRHSVGDWGEVCKEDWQENNRAAANGDRILSAYTVTNRKFWVITEWDRSVTTVLLPEEY